MTDDISWNLVALWMLIQIADIRLGLTCKPGCTCIMMTSSNGNIFRVTGPLWGEFTGPCWIPHTNASDAELWCFLWSAPWINGWVNNREAGDLRRYRAHSDVTVMMRGYDSRGRVQKGVLYFPLQMHAAAVLLWLHHHVLWNRVTNSPIFFRVASMALGWSNNYPSGGKVKPEGYGSIRPKSDENKLERTAKMCIILRIFSM